MRPLAHFWYSPQQWEARRRSGEPRIYARIILGSSGIGMITEYTEAQPGLLSIQPNGTWDDYRWLGLGWFHRMER